MKIPKRINCKCDGNVINVNRLEVENRDDTSRSISFLFLLARVILASSCPSFTRYARHSLASCPFSIPSAPRGTREECNDDRRAETPERMGCGMEKRRGQGARCEGDMVT